MEQENKLSIKSNGDDILDQLIKQAEAFAKNGDYASARNCIIEVFEMFEKARDEINSEYPCF